MKNKNSKVKNFITVLITGIGGGSLGIEIFKSLRHAGGYRLIGTDISKTAFGFKEGGFERTYLLRRMPEREYALQLLGICLKNKVDVVAPGSGETHKILAKNRCMFEQKNILLMLNSKKVIDLCSDKLKSLRFLEKKGIPIPAIIGVTSKKDVKDFKKFPCVVKPTKASGGSNLVFIAEDKEEALFFVDYLKQRGYNSLLQEYIASKDEYTVGVLSSPSGEILGSIALKRSLDQKLSCALKYGDRIISSGWSQGEINDFMEIRKQAECIAKILQSKWALNIQGRVDSNGIFYPFEINPRHSGTTYLRTLAGFNEPHILLQYCLKGHLPPRQPLKKGYYLRGFIEKYLSKDEIKKYD